MDTRHPITRWLERTKWSQARLAQEAGISDSLLSKYLAGKVDISTNTARSLRDVTGLSLDAICESVASDSAQRAAEPKRRAAGGRR